MLKTMKLREQEVKQYCNCTPDSCATPTQEQQRVLYTAESNQGHNCI